MPTTDAPLAMLIGTLFVCCGMILVLIAVLRKMTGKTRQGADVRGLTGVLGPMFIILGCAVYLTGKAPATPALSKRDACDSFALQALKQNDEKERLGCDFSGPKWQGYYENYYKWCLAGPDDFAEVEFNAREAELSECAANG